MGRWNFLELSRPRNVQQGPGPLAFAIIERTGEFSGRDWGRGKWADLLRPRFRRHRWRANHQVRFWASRTPTVGWYRGGIRFSLV